MKLIYVFIIFNLFTISVFSSGSEGSLRLVHVFFRHGSRTPDIKDIYPTDPYGLETFHPMGYGALTNQGKLMSFKLGELLRKRYDSFLGQIYYPEFLEATSTDYRRTKMTLLLVLAGLFPPAKSQMWHETLDWMPVPTTYDKAKNDFILRRPTSYCPAYVKELARVEASKEVQAYLEENAELMQYIEDNTKKPIKTLLDVFQIYQTLTAEHNLNLTLPKWAQSIYPDKIEKMAAQRCVNENSTPVLRRLNGGRMLKKVIEQMREKAENTLSPRGRKMFLYSAHENNVLNILAALGLFRPHFPKYTSATIVELHYVEDTKVFGVKVFYLRDYQSVPELQKIPNCDELCPLDEFVKIAADYLPGNYTAECESSVNFELYESKSSEQ